MFHEPLTFTDGIHTFMIDFSTLRKVEGYLAVFSVNNHRIFVNSRFGRNSGLHTYVTHHFPEHLI